MKTASLNHVLPVSRRAFTLVELMVATAASIGLVGLVALMLLESAIEQRYAYANTTVEEKAYVLQANLIKCLRTMSGTQGVSPDYSSGPSPSGPYASIKVFYPTNGAYIQGSITFDPASGRVLYIPNILAPTTNYLWMSNSSTAVLTSLSFSTSQNLDSSQNNSLVNVLFQMNDNGFSQQGTVNNPASIFRNFSVQLRNDY